MNSEFSIRLASEEDITGILEIYNPIVVSTPISFEYEVPSDKTLKERFFKKYKHYPFIVGLQDNRLTGYAYASPHRERTAYQWAVETSIYVHPKYKNKGFATCLYTSLLKILKVLGYFNAYAGIVTPNKASEAFHQSMGFKHIGTYSGIGFKLDKWHNVNWWEYEIQRKITNPDTPKSIVTFSDIQKINYILSNSLKMLKT
ncbi:MAG: N-acetyltransferase family protein [Bacteroidota bacterium]